jgi:hypothetical protein
MASWMTRRTFGAKLVGSFTAVRVVLHGLRCSRLVDRRLGGQTTCSWGIGHLLPFAVRFYREGLGFTLLEGQTFLWRTAHNST